VYRYRNQVQCLDTAQTLTRGSPVGPWAMLEHLRLEHGSYTCVLRQGGGLPSLIGQMHYNNGERAARLSFVMPIRELDTPGLIALLESLAWEAGQRGAFSLLAEVEENSPVFESLRRAGFSVYAWQHVWKIDLTGQQDDDQTSPWDAISDLDDFAIRGLYQLLTPPLVQSAEHSPDQVLQGLVYGHKGEILAFVAPTYGPHGIYLQPLIHPTVENVPRLLRSLLNSMSFQMGRPVYLAVRSYQAWLENALHDLNAQASPRQALLVKHLGKVQRASVYATRNGVLEKRQPAMIHAPGSESPRPLAQFVDHERAKDCPEEQGTLG
jgi:hypothetical protein